MKNLDQLPIPFHSASIDRHRRDPMSIFGRVPLMFLANEANRKIEETTKKVVHISAFAVPNFWETFFSCHANATGACADTITPMLLRIDIPCILLFLILRE